MYPTASDDWKQPRMVSMAALSLVFRLYSMVRGSMPFSSRWPRNAAVWAEGAKLSTQSKPVSGPIFLNMVRLLSRRQP